MSHSIVARDSVCLSLTVGLCSRAQMNDVLIPVIEMNIFQKEFFPLKTFFHRTLIFNIWNSRKNSRNFSCLFNKNSDQAYLRSFEVKNYEKAQNITNKRLIGFPQATRKRELYLAPPAQE